MRVKGLSIFWTSDVMAITPAFVSFASLRLRLIVFLRVGGGNEHSRERISCHSFRRRRTTLFRFSYSAVQSLTT